MPATITVSDRRPFKKFQTGIKLEAVARAEELYEKCLLSQPLGHAFSLAELSELAKVGSAQELLQMTDLLIDECLFILCRSVDGQNEASWKARERKQAQIIQRFNSSERQVYEHIAEAQREGIWTRTLETRTGLHTNTVRKVVKDLKAKNFVKDMKSVKAASRKMLILRELEPSEASSGGPFFQEGELDEGLIHTIAFVVCRYVEERSWPELPRRPVGERNEGRPRNTDTVVERPTKRKRVFSADVLGSDQAAPKRRKADTRSMTVTHAPATGAVPKPRARKFGARDYVRPMSARRRPLVPQAPRHTFYSTNTTVYEHLQTHVKAAFQHVNMDTGHLRVLLEMLTFDDRLEQMSRDLFLAIRRSFESMVDHRNTEDDARETQVGTGMTESPCGRCPISELCEVGGQVAPESCSYYQDWTEMKW